MKFYPIGLYFLLILILFHSVLTGDRTFQVTWDSSVQSFAWLTFNFKSIQSGSFALWDFSTFSGSSFVGELQTAPFYPLTLIFALFSKIGVPFFIDLLILTHFLIAAIFTHLLLKKLGFGSTACWIGAAVFAFCGPVAARAPGQPNLHAGLTLIPLVLLLALNGFRAESFRQSIKWIFACGIALGMMILAGHVHSYLHAFLCLAIFSFFIALQNPGGKFGRSLLNNGLFLVLSGIASITVSAVQIIPAYEYLQLSYKWFGDSMTRFPHIVPFEEYAANSLNLSGLRSLIDVSVPVGTTDLTTLYVGIPALVLVLFSFSKWRSPIFQFGLFSAVIAFLIAFGGENLLGRTFYNIPILNLVRIPTRALHLWGFAAAILAALGMESILSLSGKGRVRIFILVIFAGGTFWETYRFSQLLTGPVTAELSPISYYQENPLVQELNRLDRTERQFYRFTSRPKELIPPNLGEVYDLRGINGHRSSMQAEYADFLGEGTDLFSEKLDLLGVKWIVTDEKIDGLKALAQIEENSVYERPNPLPVFWISDEDGESIPAPIKGIEWHTNAVELALNEFKGKSLVFSQPYYPGWKATADGKPRSISKFQIFTQVELKPGDQVIRLEYSPWFFPSLAWVSFLFSLLTAGLFALDGFSFRKN